MVGLTKIIAALATVLVALHAAEGQQSPGGCPTFGTDQSTALSRSSNSYIYMNFDSPSQCRGNVTGWNFCFYRNQNNGGDDDDDNEDGFSNSQNFAALFIVYRRQSPTSDIYSAVGSAREKTFQWRVVEDSSFQCMQENLSPNEYVEVQENDIVGACIKNTQSVEPLLLVGTDGNAATNTYRLFRFGSSDCSTSMYSNVDTDNFLFSQTMTSTLHLHASINTNNSPSLCTAGQNAPAGSPVSSVVGNTYINTQAPVTCNNHVTKWHYCYYTGSVMAGTTLSMTVGVWSLDNDTNSYSMSPNSAKTLSVQHVQTRARVFCVEYALNDAESFFVSEDDVVGVIFPPSNAIPLVGTISNSLLSTHLYTDNENTTNISRNLLQSLPSTVLHLYVSIDYQDIPTTLPNTVSSTTTMETTTEAFVTSAIPTEMQTTDVSTTEVPTSQPSTQQTLATTMVDTTTAMSTNAMSTEKFTMQMPTTGPKTEMQTSEEQTTRMATSVMDATSQADIAEASMIPATATMSLGNIPTDTLPHQPSTESSSITSNDPLGKSSSASDDIESTSGEMATTISAAVDNNTRSRGLSGGDIAAIALSLLLTAGVVLLIAFILLYYCKRNKKKYNATPGLENVMYIGSKQKNRSVYDSIAEPYIYSDTMSLPTSRDQQTQNHDYQFVDYEYYTPMMDASAYQQELESIRRGSIYSHASSVYMDPGNTEDEIYSFLKSKKITNIPGVAITIGTLVGSGNYGNVFEGEWKPSVASKQFTDVAIKALKKDASSNDKLKFLQEAAIMAQFHHPNVAKLYGVTEKNGTMMIVVELISKGDLLHFLKGLQPDPGELVQPSTPHLLLQFSQQICLGMSYLASTGFVHRDLAARNVLISDCLICKIADFGMSRELRDEDYYKSSGGKIPLKWTAPEAIHYKKFSTASDVWSYGCVLYEIWSLGHKPFEENSNVEVLQLLEAGNRPPPPPGCPRDLYQLMMECWHPVPKKRPEFKELLQSLLENAGSVLRIPTEATETHQLAATLGAPLHIGYNMYIDIQKTHTK